MEKAKWSGFIDGPEGTKSIHKQVLLVAESSSSGVACWRWKQKQVSKMQQGRQAARWRWRYEIFAFL